jgi:hypothetical protein
MWPKRSRRFERSDARFFAASSELDSPRVACPTPVW